MLDQTPLKDSKHLYFNSDQGGFSTSKLRCQRGTHLGTAHLIFKWESSQGLVGSAETSCSSPPLFGSKIPFSPVIKACTLSWSDIYFLDTSGGDIYQFQDLESKDKRSLLYWHRKKSKNRIKKWIYSKVCWAHTLWPSSEHSLWWFLETADCGEGREKRRAGLTKPHQGGREATGNVKFASRAQIGKNISDTW